MKPEIAIGTITIENWEGKEVWGIATGRFSVVEVEEGEWFFDLWAKKDENALIESTTENIYSQGFTLEVTGPLGDIAPDGLEGNEVAFGPADSKDWDDASIGNISGNMYCGRHVTLDNFKLQFIAKEDSGIRLRLTAKVPDTNFYDGSKPRSTVTIECIMALEDELKGHWVQ